MRILCAAAAYPPYAEGGGPVASESIAKALCARNHVVRVITVADGESSEWRNGVEIKTLSSLNIYWNYWIKQPPVKKAIWHLLENFNPRAFFRMRREIAEFRPDVVLTLSIENINVATWIAAWLAGCPCVHMVQSYFLMCWRGSMFSKNKNCARRCFQCRVASMGKKLCARSVRGVTAESLHSLNLHYDNGYFRGVKAKVIPAAVNSPVTSTHRDQQVGDIRVGFIGLLTPNKGIATLAQAATLLGNDAPFQYLIAGRGRPEFVQELQALFPSSKTKFLGWTDAA